MSSIVCCSKGGKLDNISVYFACLLSCIRFCHRVIPDRLMKSHGVSRTASLVVLSALAAACAVLNAFSGLQLLNLAAFLTGFAFGGMQVTYTSTFFGIP